MPGEMRGPFAFGPPNTKSKLVFLANYVIGIMIRSSLPLCLLFVVCSLESQAQDNPHFLSIGEQRTIYSNTLEESRDIIVGLPEGYESDSVAYPVIYLLDGKSNFLHTIASTRFLAASGRIPGVIVVAIPNTDRVRDLTPSTEEDSLGVFPTAGGANNFLEFISTELKPFIAEHYRTRPHSILIGHSFGGLFALHTLVHRPQVFDAYIAISPSFWWDNQRLIAQADSSFDYFGERVGDLYMTLGNEGSFTSAGNEGNEMLGGVLKLAGIMEEKVSDTFRWQFKHMQAETHGSVPLRSTYDGLEKIFDGWYLHDPVNLFEIGGLSAIDRFYDRKSERFGYKESAPSIMLYQIGNKALEIKDASEAEGIFTRILELDPGSAAAHLGLAEAYAIMGNDDAAISHYQHTLKNDPKNQEAREELTLLGVDLSDYPENVVVSTDVLKSYTGKYKFQEFELEVLIKENELILSGFGQKLELYPLATNRFRSVAYDEVSVTFNKSDDTGVIISMTIVQQGSPMQAQKVE